jgi:hypothetical protein
MCAAVGKVGKTRFERSDLVLFGSGVVGIAASGADRAVHDHATSFWWG